MMFTLRVPGVFGLSSLGYYLSVAQNFCQGYCLWGIGFHPEANNSLYGASEIYILCKILLRVIGFHPESKHGYIWKSLCIGLTEFYLAFGYWSA